MPPYAVRFGNRDRVGAKAKGEWDEIMKVLRSKLKNTDGQGLVEYMLVVFLVAFVFWVAMKDTAAGGALTDLWSKVYNCVATPFSCSSG